MLAGDSPTCTSPPVARYTVRRQPPSGVARLPGQQQVGGERVRARPPPRGPCGPTSSGPPRPRSCSAPPRAVPPGAASGGAASQAWSAGHGASAAGASGSSLPRAPPTTAPRGRATAGPRPVPAAPRTGRVTRPAGSGRCAEDAARLHRDRAASAPNSGTPARRFRQGCHPSAAPQAAAAANGAAPAAGAGAAEAPAAGRQELPPAVAPAAGPACLAGPLESSVLTAAASTVLPASHAGGAAARPRRRARRRAERPRRTRRRRLRCAGGGVAGISGYPGSGSASGSGSGSMPGTSGSAVPPVGAPAFRPLALVRLRTGRSPWPRCAPGLMCLLVFVCRHGRPQLPPDCPCHTVRGTRGLSIAAP